MTNTQMAPPSFLSRSSFFILEKSKTRFLGMKAKNYLAKAVLTQFFELGDQQDD